MHKGTKARCFCGSLNPGAICMPPQPPAVAVGKTLAAQTLGRVDAQGTFVHHRATQPMWPAVMILTQHFCLATIAQMISEMRRADRRRTHCRPSSRSLPRLSSRAAGSDRPLHLWLVLAIDLGSAACIHHRVCLIIRLRVSRGFGASLPRGPSTPPLRHSTNGVKTQPSENGGLQAVAHPYSARSSGAGSHRTFYSPPRRTCPAQSCTGPRLRSSRPACSPRP